MPQHTPETSTSFAGKSSFRQAINVVGLLGVFTFSWVSHSFTLFNGLASPLFFVLAAYLVILATQYKLSVSPASLLLFSLFAAWAIVADVRSGEVLPALAIDTHWLVLPLAALLIAQVFREFPLAFQAIRIGAALCIVNLLLTLWVEADRYWNWHYPPIFGHIRHLGLSIGFMSLLLFTKDEVSGWVALFFRLARILGLALVFWSGTRASMLAWLCCMAVFIYADRRWAKTLLVDTVIAMALSQIPEPALPNGGLFGAFFRSIDARSADALSSLRLAIWKATIAGLDGIGRLWTGVGGNGFARLQVMHEVVVSTRRYVQAHNGIVQSICDWGLIGVTLLAAFFARSTVLPVVVRRKINDPTALAGVVYILVTGMFDATLYHLEHLNYLAIALAYLFSQYPPESGRKISIPVPIVIVLVLGLALIHTQTFDYRIGLPLYFPTQ